MSEKPKEHDEQDQKPRRLDKTDLWEEDQKKHGYYYDDAHGYEVYEPDNQQGEEDDSEAAP